MIKSKELFVKRFLPLSVHSSVQGSSIVVHGDRHKFVVRENGHQSVLVYYTYAHFHTIIQSWNRLSHREADLNFINHVPCRIGLKWNDLRSQS